MYTDTPTEDGLQYRHGIQYIYKDVLITLYRDYRPMTGHRLGASAQTLSM